MTKNVNYIAPFLLAMLVFAACDPNSLYEQNKNIEGKSWNRFQSQTFDVAISDTMAACNVLVNIRNTNHYPFRNLYMFITTTSPSGKSIRDTVEMLLADERGQWFGKGLNGLFTLQQAYRKNVRFPETGTYSFRIEQAMRTADLPGITNVGLRVEKVSQ